MAHRTWRWLRTRIEAVVGTPDTYSLDGVSGVLLRVPANRVRSALFPMSVIEPQKGGG